MSNAAEQQNAVESATLSNWRQLIVRPPSTHQVEPITEIKRYWDFFGSQGKAMRLHIQQTQGPESADRKLMYGYFDNLEALTAAVSQYVESSRIYASLNWYEPDSTIIPLNQIREAEDTGVREGNFAGCKHLLITPEPGASAEPGAEADAVAEMASRVADTLSGLKWANPAIIDDGSGINLIYRIDQDEAFAAEPVIQELLAHLAGRLGETGGLIDVNIAHPAFMIPLPGTKQQNAADNTSRQCQIIHLPAQWEKVTKKKLLMFLPSGIPKKRGKRKAANSEVEDDEDDVVGRLFDIVQGMEFFHDEMKHPFVRVNRGGHNEIADVRDKEFKNWLRYEYFNRHAEIVPTEALKQVVDTLAGKAVYAGAMNSLHLRVAEKDQDIWYDLANDKWQAILVTPDGWARVDAPPIIFRRYRKSAAQVLPLPTGGDIKRVLQFVNIRSEEEKCLFLTYLVYCFVPNVPKPLVHPHGEKGAAKSTMSRIIKKLVDPGNIETASLPTNKNELIIQLAQTYMALYDNIDTLTQWQSDALCCGATGGGMAKRELFSSEGEQIFRFMRPIILNGINTVAQRSDLLDRCLLFHLERIADTERTTEAQLWHSFKEARPIIMGGIFDTLSAAMKIYPTVILDSMPRMADFAQWGSAIAEALGYTRKYFLDAYSQNIKEANQTALDSHPLATAILQMMETETNVEASAGDILIRLETVAVDHHIRTSDKLFPKSSSMLVRRMKEVRSNLLVDGIQVLVTRDARNNSLIRIFKVAETPVQEESA